MSLMREILQDTPDAVIVPGGKQYQLEITKAVFGATKGDGDKPIRPMITLYLKVLDNPNSQMLSDFLWFPIESDMDDVDINQRRKIKNTLLSLNIDPEVDGDVDIETFTPDMENEELRGWKGKMGFAVLGVQTLDDGRKINNVKYWLRSK